MTTVLVTHPRDKLDSYFGNRAIEALCTLPGVTDARFNPQARELAAADLVEAARGCDVVIAYRQTEAPAALFAALPQLAAFLRCAVDIRTIDVPAASAHGVLVTQASAGFAAAVSEWIVAMMVDLARGISRYAAGYAAGRPLAPIMGRELRGSVLGIVGYGEIGQYLARLAQAFGMRVLVNTLQPVEACPELEPVPLAALLAGSDFVVCLAPANADTANLMNAAAFAAMRRGSFFINASRGELVDDDALLLALDRGHLAGCALDVGRAPDQMPTSSLARHPAVIASPHIGGLTLPAVEHQALETVAQLKALLHGEMPAGAVNPDFATRLHRWRAASTPGTGGGA
jgi:D-3-phosphoglycerate dehydrogenase / 2-oxoglutarate reductase